MIAQDIKLYVNTVWGLLLEKRKVLISEIHEITNYSEVFIFLALGWLAKDNKINFYLDQNGALCVKINESYVDVNTPVNKPYTDIYY